MFPLGGRKQEGEEMKRISNKLAMLLLAMTMSIGMVGCGQAKQAETAPQESSGQVIGKVEVAYPVTITDSFNREVTIEEEPQKVISVSPSITEMLYSLGLQDKLVARTNYCDYPAEVADVPSIGEMMTPDIEQIISLEPDVVITSAHFDKDVLLKLEGVGIKVIELYEESDVNGTYNMFETLGKVFNVPQKAEEIVSDMKVAIEDVQKKVEGLEKPSVYYVVSYGEYGDFTAPLNSYVGQFIETAGGQNIAPASDSWTFSLEALLEADPDIIIVRQGDKEGFMATEGYKELTAVKEGRVYEIDSNLLDRQGYRNVEGVQTLAKIFHPEAFK